MKFRKWIRRNGNQLTIFGCLPGLIEHFVRFEPNSDYLWGILILLILGLSPTWLNLKMDDEDYLEIPREKFSDAILMFLIVFFIYFMHSKLVFSLNSCSDSYKFWMSIFVTLFAMMICNGVILKRRSKAS